MKMAYAAPKAQVQAHFWGCRGLFIDAPTHGTHGPENRIAAQQSCRSKRTGPTGMPRYDRSCVRTSTCTERWHAQRFNAMLHDLREQRKSKTRRYVCH